MKTAWSCLGWVKRGVEKWFQFRLVRNQGSPNPRLRDFLPRISRNAESGFMHCCKTIIKRVEERRDRGEFLSFYLCSAPHSSNQTEAHNPRNNE